MLLIYLIQIPKLGTVNNYAWPSTTADSVTSTLIDINYYLIEAVNEI